MVRSGFRNFCFRNWFVTENAWDCIWPEQGIVCWMFGVVFIKIGLSGLSPNYFRGQAWPDLWPRITNVCYCHKFNDILKM